MARTPSRQAVASLQCLAFTIAAVAASPHATAHSFCVGTAAELREALAAVSDGGPYVNEASTIRVAGGIYLTAGEAFRSDALTTTAQLEIHGGWRPGCATMVPRPTSVLDAQGSSGVLIVNRPQGLVSLSRLVLQNGNADVGAGLRVNYGTAGAAIVSLYQVLIRNNHASGDGGGAYIFGAAPVNYAPIHMYSVLIADNSSGGEGGGAYLRITGGGSTRFGFFTVANNSSASGTTGGLYLTGDQGGYWYHGLVAWGNTPAGLYFGLPGTLGWSVYDAMAPGVPPTLDHVLNEDPRFADPANGNYRLGSGTPLIRYCPCVTFQPADLAGVLIPAYGNPFNAEIGAYMETIFVDDNEE